jgi:hypothetical protein
MLKDLAYATMATGAHIAAIQAVISWDAVQADPNQKPWILITLIMMAGVLALSKWSAHKKNNQ